MERSAKIFVAGHNGLVGSAICRALVAEGYANIETRTREELDLTDQAATRAFFDEVRPEYVFLAAAKVGGIGANMTYPAEFIAENLAIAMNVIDAAHRAGVKKLLNLGSSCIYPRDAAQPIHESALLTGPLEETNRPYAIAKIAAIELCTSYNRQYGTDFISIMPTNLYGIGDNYDLQGSHVLPALIAKFHQARVDGADTVTLWGDGSPLREFLYADDLGEAAVFIMQNLSAEQVGGWMNVGSGEEISIADLALLVREVVFAGSPESSNDTDHTGISLPAIVWDTSMPNGTPRKLMDSNRINSLGWRPQTPIREGIAVAYDDYLSRYHGA